MPDAPGDPEPPPHDPSARGCFTSCAVLSALCLGGPLLVTRGWDWLSGVPADARRTPEGAIVLGDAGPAFWTIFWGGLFGLAGCLVAYEAIERLSKRLAGGIAMILVAALGLWLLRVAYGDFVAVRVGAREVELR